MKAKYIIAALIAIYLIGFFVVMMNYESKIRQKQIIIISQQKTIQYLTAKYIGTNAEQELLKEANKLLKERNNAK
jgi:hypothetical protein